MPASKTEDRLYEALRRAVLKTSSIERPKLRIEREPHVGPFKPDFLFPELGLIVEVEGPYHLSLEASRRDHERENYFQNNGYYTIRVSAEQVFDDADSVASYILETASHRQKRENTPPIRRGKKAHLMLVQFDDGSGFWVEHEEASKWWDLYSESLREDWLRNGQGEKTHESLHWNRYVQSDHAIRATLDYESTGPEDASRFAQRLLGRRVVSAVAVGHNVVVKIDLS